MAAAGVAAAGGPGAVLQAASSQQPAGAPAAASVCLVMLTHMCLRGYRRLLNEAVRAVSASW